VSGCKWLKVVAAGCKFVIGCEWLRLVASGSMWYQIVPSLITHGVVSVVSGCK
jgi:hypothetical protein